MPKNSKMIHPGPVTIRIGRPIPTMGKDLPQLMEEVYKAIKNGYIDLDGTIEADPIIHKLEVQTEKLDSVTAAQR